jgi:hypothetical protein
MNWERQWCQIDKLCANDAAYKKIEPFWRNRSEQENRALQIRSVLTAGSMAFLIPAGLAYTYEQMTRRNPLALAMGSRSASIIFYA